MTKRDKRLKTIRQNPKNVSKEMLDGILRDYGFVPRSGKGSHTVYQHSDLGSPIVVAAHGAHVPSYIVKQALEAIDQVIEMQKQSEKEDNEDD